ncbi:asparaginase domain-containing protein [Jongsikchunia kroppenstedtii]|uniref:asparaginase domain-containing protein n=1 Tax=Jongsikchunia kroppenstedtii TaxID=1121721 RepID=UPI00036DA636|nr:asparaginase domain-containing protein [Jongsikchunia kroppenstedtii]
MTTPDRTGIHDPGVPTIVLLATGGTIAARSGAAGAQPVVSGGDLAGQAAGAPDVPIRVRDLAAADSAALTPADQDAVRRAVADALVDPAVGGVVILHGTDTLEETAMLIDLSHTDPRPVVITGAQRSNDHPDADGPANLGLAIATAADPAARGRGVLLAFAGSVMPVRGIIKADTTAAAAFTGPLRPLARIPVAPADIAAHRVDIIALHPGADSAMLDWHATQGARAIVLQANGSGNTHPYIVGAVGRLTADGVVVVVSTRVPFGPVEAVYGGGGGAVDLVAAGAIISTWLRPPQARIALMALLAAGADTAAIADFFRRTVPEP